MGVIIDTSEMIAFERQAGRIEDIVSSRSSEPCAISVITVAELLHGVERADTEARKLSRQAFVERTIDFFPVIPFDTSIARIYARLWASLASKGNAVDPHDLIIAATALSMDYTLITRNIRDFEKIAGLKIEKL